ncbi:tRNA (adenosine(37)-N6)-threonylcarbamoyltransferase complex ATPase subunit type 1 TsaE [Aquimarina sp. ERC-38]|uniref:tRNA (adenosine(37)-N6)-threonylcarbamoyltransferase complex ATPase subunit type 1 TsaE n=1 Tax=Aquimarina sp. ERC-38 TaxID=2949996 RepID=UPI00224762A9|nr:tRNA (adenosine(37)-N6)-threonylcarbamoyltransferase complex ATPase subunit type 1 TsaE [Aquimarina sp. ERC-38]UZO79499.1 tRNA (adenosine(37)-N6)-threonylcarbamoyltransferase complex ATPase subunit type 1 TsaE [Aquimarina sp. ERC-38]
MKVHTLTYSLTELETAADFIIQNSASKIILFDAAMGMGKTTLIKQLCTSLRTQDTVSSPTFALVNEYQGADSKIFHFDLYRIKDINEALDMGFEEYLYQDAWVFIEWPDKVKPLLPEQFTTVKIDQAETDVRKLSIENTSLVSG